MADACTITPALRTWIECLVDTRIDQCCRSFRENDLAALVQCTRREGAAASATAMAAVQSADQARQNLELQVRGLADAQARLLAVVESFSGDAERQHSSSSKARAEALVTVERVMSTVDELQRTVEQDGDGANTRLRQHDAALEEIRRMQTEESIKHRATLTELQRVQSEASARQRQCSDELAGACGTIAATRQEVGDLAQMVQRLESRLQGWRAEVTSELSDELSARVLSRDSLLDADRLKFEALQREVAGASSARIEVEARLDALRVEFTGLTSFRADIESRFREGQQALSRRVDALQVAAVKDVEGVKHEVEELVQSVERLDHRSSSWRAEVSKEIRQASAAREAVELAREQGAAGLEGFRHEVSQHWSELEHRLERLQLEMTANAAAREESLRMRDATREAHEDLKRALEHQHRHLRSEMEALQQQAAGDRESLSGWRAEVREEMAQLQRRLGLELRAETRAFLKTEQNAIAALDEQLWLTDQRLGQRIDELVQAAGRGERIAAVAGAAEQAGRGGMSSSSAPRADLRSEKDSLERRCNGGLSGLRMSEAEQLERLRASRKRAEISLRTEPRASDPLLLRGDRNSGHHIMHDSPAAEIAAPARGGALRRSLSQAAATTRSALCVAREAAEAFEEVATTP